MLKHINIKLRDCFRRDPWLIAKFAVVTLALGFIGKLLLFGAVEGGDINPTYAQFVPTVPMMGLTFLSHRYLWGHCQTSLLSRVGANWSKSYWTQFVVGHGLFTVFAGLLGWQYLAVSLSLGVISALVTFTLNEWKIFRSGRRQAEIVRA